MTGNLTKFLPIIFMSSVETLRKYPPLPFIDRRCNKTYKVPDHDLVIEKGTPVYVSMIGMHYDPKYYDEPEKYKPERFSSDNLHNFTWLPFGEGPRSCIGKVL